MVRLSQIVLRRGRFVSPDAEPASYKHFKFGPVKWRDYKSPYVEPPYWYKWSLASPYSPMEQTRIRMREDVGWYIRNYDKIKITPPEQWLYHVGDKVQILAGKDNGKTGEVIRVIPQRNWVVIGGLNLKYQTSESGESYAEEQPLEHDEVSLLDPVDKQPTEVVVRADENGNKVRVSLKSDRIIVKPPELLHDLNPVSSYLDQEKDTTAQSAMARTYVPSVKSMEEELKSLYKIEDDEPRNFFWY